MTTTDLTVLIPALKKTVAFQDDLVKKLDGISLIQRAINKAIEIDVPKSDIYILTDSEEIQLIAERNRVQVYRNAALVWDEKTFDGAVGEYLQKLVQYNEFILLLSVYAPLIPVKLINNAKQTLVGSNRDILQPVKQVKKHLYDKNNKTTCLELFGGEYETHTIESKAFMLLRSRVLDKKPKQQLSVLPWLVDHDVFEIESFQDWWVCEKLINRKRIVFRVIGNKKVGMGNIYRALSLAHEITDHEVLFVSDTDNIVAVKKLAGYDYWLEIYDPDEVIKKIIELSPDLVINDILSTSEKDIQQLQQNGIKVVNFEDVGDGALQANLVINELYDEPQFHGNNILWGNKYLFVRDEFHNAIPHSFKEEIDSILLTFGGTDQHDLSSKIYQAIRDICIDRHIHVHIVAGLASHDYDKLQKNIEKENNVTLTRATGVMSAIMEKTQLAISANGRTVYELAHMNIPAIVIAQHERENTHKFSCEENGFVPVGIYKKDETEKKVRSALNLLLDDLTYRKILFNRICNYQFNNKHEVLDKILSIIE